MPVGDAQHLLAVILIAPALAPQLGRLQGRHQHLERAGAVLLLAHDLFDLAQHLEAQRQPAIDARARLSDHAGAQHEAVRDDLRLARILLDERQEILRETHGTSLRAGANLGNARRDVHARGWGYFFVTWQASASAALASGASGLPLK